MAKTYVIETPEQLRALGVFIKEGSIKNVATVWSATRRGSDNGCPWDGKIFASFQSEKGKRMGIIYRIGCNGKMILASVKYVACLGWCRTHLGRCD